MKLLRSALLALALLPILRADFDPAHWRFRRSIVLSAQRPVARVKADSVLYEGSAARLVDVRILRDGVEEPYALDTMSGGSENREIPASMLDKTIVPGEGLEFTLDAGAGARHDRLRVSTPNRNFKQRVKIETSDDRRHWATARNDGVIFDVSESDRNASALTVDYPVSTRRYVRVTISSWSDVKAIDSAWLTFHDERAEVRETVADFERPQQTDDSKSQSTDVLLDIGYEGLPHDRLLVDVEPGLFTRAVQVECSRDRQTWTYAGQGTISRTPQGESLSIVFAEQWSRYVRLRIWNHDDRPLAIPRVRLQALVRYIRFPASASGAYRLYYGNAAARQPSYDLAAVLPGDSTSPDAVAKLGAQENNPAYRPPSKPLSDRSPVALYLILAAAILGMGYVTVRLLMKVKEVKV